MNTKFYNDFIDLLDPYITENVTNEEVFQACLKNADSIHELAKQAYEGVTLVPKDIRAALTQKFIDQVSSKLENPYDRAFAVFFDMMKKLEAQADSKYACIGIMGGALPVLSHFIREYHKELYSMGEGGEA